MDAGKGLRYFQETNIFVGMVLITRTTFKLAHSFTLPIKPSVASLPPPKISISSVTACNKKKKERELNKTDLICSVSYLMGSCFVDGGGECTESHLARLLNSHWRPLMHFKKLKFPETG